MKRCVWVILEDDRYRKNELFLSVRRPDPRTRKIEQGFFIFGPPLRKIVRVVGCVHGFDKVVATTHGELYIVLLFESILDIDGEVYKMSEDRNEIFGDESCRQTRSCQCWEIKERKKKGRY
jgi:hypothetical protein